MVFLLQVQPSVMPPRVNLFSIGKNRRLLLVHLAANRQSLFFPTADGALVTLQICGDFFPGVESFARRFRQVTQGLGFADAHTKMLLPVTVGALIVAYPPNMANQPITIARAG